MACKIQKQLGFELVSLGFQSPRCFRSTTARASSCSPGKHLLSSLPALLSLLPNTSTSHYFLRWARNSTQQQARKTDSGNHSAEEQKSALVSARGGDLAPPPAATNTGQGPARLQTAPRSQVFVKAHVQFRPKEASREGCSFPAAWPRRAHR